MQVKDLDTKVYLELSKERRQVNASMLSILKLFNDLRGKENCFISLPELDTL